MLKEILFMGGVTVEKILKAVSMWAVLIFILLILLMLLGSATVQMIAPTFFPEADISGFIDVIQTASVLLSVISLVSGVVSLVLSHQSGKQAEKILEGVSELNKQCNLLGFMLGNTLRTYSFQNTPPPPSSSGPDDITD